MEVENMKKSEEEGEAAEELSTIHFHKLRTMYCGSVVSLSGEKSRKQKRYTTMNIQLEAIQLTQQISHLCNYSHYKLYSDSVGAAGFSKEGFKVAMAHGTHGIFFSATLPPRNNHLMSYASCHHVAAS